MSSIASSVSGIKKRKKTPEEKLQKNPDAPKRFKSAYIFFSQATHPLLRSQLRGDNKKKDACHVAKLVSIAWKKLPAEERNVWIDKAEKDKRRFQYQQKHFTGPWKIPVCKRSKKDSGAPKRPMSSFLAYSKVNRASVRKENPKVRNTDISKILAVNWKNASEEEKADYKKQETEKLRVYKADSSEWRTMVKRIADDERKKRDDHAHQMIDETSTNEHNLKRHGHAEYVHHYFTDRDSSLSGQHMNAGDAVSFYHGSSTQRRYAAVQEQQYQWGPGSSNHGVNNNPNNPWHTQASNRNPYSMPHSHQNETSSLWYGSPNPISSGSAPYSNHFLPSNARGFEPNHADFSSIESEGGTLMGSNPMYCNDSVHHSYGTTGCDNDNSYLYNRGDGYIPDHMQARQYQRNQCYNQGSHLPAL